MLIDDILYNAKKVYLIPGLDTKNAPIYISLKPKKTIIITTHAKRNNNNQRRGSD